MIKVLICSASPDRLSNNAVLRNYVARGFGELPGVAAVRSCSYETAELHARAFGPDLGRR